MNRVPVGLLAATLLLLAGASGAAAQDITKTYTFEVDTWNEIEVVDGAVDLHRIRLELKHDRLTQATLARRGNEEYLQPIRYHLEYSNSSTAHRQVRVEVRWLDSEGLVIDGFGGTEKLTKNSSHRVVQSSVVTSKYGLDQAKTLELELRIEP